MEITHSYRDGNGYNHLPGESGKTVCKHQRIAKLEPVPIEYTVMHWCSDCVMTYYRGLQDGVLA